MKESAGLAFFVLFWLVTLLVFIFHTRPVVRRLYMILFLCILVITGLFGRFRWLWPFHDWHLWGGVRAYQGEFYELHVEDGAGNLLLYDYRSIPPKLPTQTQLLAGLLLRDDHPDHHVELTTFLLTKANQWREELESNASPLAVLSFPSREFGHRWTVEQIQPVDAFVRLRARRVGFVISPDGKDVEQSLLEERSFP